MWKGFVMVNLDPACEPFETYATKLIEHFESFDIERRYIAFHAVKEVAANWKVVMEAFSEGYHVVATHPQIVEFTADANSEYSIWPDSMTVSRFVNTFGSPSPHLVDRPSEQQVVDAHVAFGSHGPRDAATAGRRPVGAPRARRATPALVRRTYGTDLSTRSDTEMLDAILYHLLPAFSPWAGIGQPLVYRWRPGVTPDVSHGRVPAGPVARRRTRAASLTRDRVVARAVVERGRWDGRTRRCVRTGHGEPAACAGRDAQHGAPSRDLRELPGSSTADVPPLDRHVHRRRSRTRRRRSGAHRAVRSSRRGGGKLLDQWRVPIHGHRARPSRSSGGRIRATKEAPVSRRTTRGAPRRACAPKTPGATCRDRARVGGVSLQRVPPVGDARIGPRSASSHRRTR